MHCCAPPSGGARIETRVGRETRVGLRVALRLRAERGLKPDPARLQEVRCPLRSAFGRSED